MNYFHTDNSSTTQMTNLYLSTDSNKKNKIKKLRNKHVRYIRGNTIRSVNFIGTDPKHRLYKGATEITK